MELNDALWWETIDTEVLLRLGVATLVGLLLGLDRELKGYDAGLRTHGMVALSSSLMTVVSIALYHQLGGAASSNDPLRVIEGNAAHIWLTGAIGIASGAGYFAIVIIAAGLALVLLILLRFVERRLPEVEDGPREDGANADEAKENGPKVEHGDVPR